MDPTVFKYKQSDCLVLRYHYLLEECSAKKAIYRLLHFQKLKLERLP